MRVREGPARKGEPTMVVEASVTSRDGTTIAFERSQVGALVAQAREHLGEIVAARERLADGIYGTCESCGREIPTGRLEARPTARTCVDCASGTRR